MSTEQSSIAFFDFDGTLTKGDSFLPFLKYVVGSPLFYLKLIILLPILIGYLLKLIRNDRTKEIVMTFYLKGYNYEKLLAMGDSFNQDVVPNLLRLEGMERLRWHQNRGDRTVLVSASFNLYLENWARSERFEIAITSQLEIVNGKITGKIAGKNCYGAEKVARIKEYFPHYENYMTYAYGDTEGDMPMLILVNKGYLWHTTHFFKIDHDKN